MILILGFWQFLSYKKLVPEYMLPSPISVGKAFIKDFWVLLEHSKISLSEAFLGLGLGLTLSFILAVLMDSFKILRKTIYPLLVITQTVPVVAIAPLLVLWFGYGILPKVVLVLLVCFFPIVIGLLDGLKNADKDAIDLLRAMGAKKWQIFIHIKLPYSLNGLFAGLKISVSYSIVGAVIAEWLGGNSGLGGYMTIVRKSFAFDKMFAVIFLVIVISLLLMLLVVLLEKWIMPWKKFEEKL